MKVVLVAVAGFAVGMAFGHFRQHVVHIEWLTNSLAQLPVLPAASVLPELPAMAGLPATVPRQKTVGPTLRATVEPIYRVLFGALDDPAAIGVAIEELGELEKLLATVPRDSTGMAARRVAGFLSAARAETLRAMKSSSQPVSTALGGGQVSSTFFGGVFEKRWRANMSALARKAGPEWQRLLAADAALPCTPEVQTAIATLLAERHGRMLERTALLIEGEVLEVFEAGPLVQVFATDEKVLIAGLKDAVDEASVRVLVHPNGTFQYSTESGAKKTVRKLRFFREATK